MEENPEIKNEVVAEGVKEENIVPQKSKSQIKKEKNKQKWLEDKPKRKELEKVHFADIIPCFLISDIAKEKGHERKKTFRKRIQA